jgi:GDPmannose 4,6-dehydratase
MNAIIFGINSQDGYYLKNILVNNSISVIGVSRSKGDWTIGDVNDFLFVQEIIKKNKPDYIFHLAANSTTKHDVVFENYHTISTGTLNILENVLNFSVNSKVFISGSGLQFINNGLPIKETDIFFAKDAYSMARIQSVYAARYYRTMGIKVYIGYFFNHDSPLRREIHINQKIIKAVKRIVKGSNEQIQIGNIGIKKEFTFAGDVAEAIWILINNNTVYEAVIGSGKAYSIENWLAICFNYVNLSWKNHVVINPEFKSDYDILVSNPRTIFNLGWQPRVDIESLAKLMFEK